METAVNTFLTSGYWVVLVLFLAAAAGLCYLHGLFWRKVLRTDQHPFELFATGFVSILALTEFVGWPFIACRLSSAVFTGIACAVLIIPAAAGILLPGGLIPKQKEEKGKTGWVILVPFALILAFEIVATVAIQKVNNDDSFYVSNVALFAVSDVMNPYDSSMGDITTKTMPMYDFQIWEGLMSVPCRIFRLKAAEVMHSLIIAPILLCSASAMFSLGMNLFQDRRKAFVFSSLLILFHLAARWLYLPGSFLLRRTWQGKTVNINVVFPLLTAVLLRFFFSERSERDGKGWILPLLCTLAGVALNPTSLYVNGFLLLFLSAALALGTKRYRKTISLLPSLAAIILFTLLIYFRTGSGKIESAGTAEEDFFLSAIHTAFVYSDKILPMFLAAFIYLLFRGDTRVRLCYGLASLFMLVFLWNPWIGRFVAEKITKTPTYWRVFWLAPVAPVIAWSAVDFAWSLKENRKTALAVTLLAAAFFCGGRAKEYEYAVNPQNLPQAYLEIGSWLRKKDASTPVLACEDLSTTLRQRYTEIRLLVSKRHFADDVYTYFGREEEGADRIRLFDFVNGKLKPEDMDGIDELLRRYDVEYAVLLKSSRDAVAYLKENGYKLTEKVEDYRIYQYKP